MAAKTPSLGVDQEGPPELAYLAQKIERLEARRTFTLDADERELIREIAQARAAHRGALVYHYGCSDCGAPAGRECFPDYGCTDAKRSVRREA